MGGGGGGEEVLEGDVVGGVSLFHEQGDEVARGGVELTAKVTRCPNSAMGSDESHLQIPRYTAVCTIHLHTRLGDSLQSFSSC